MKEKNLEKGDRVRVYIGSYLIIGAKGTVETVKGHDDLYCVRLDAPTPDADTPMVHRHQLRRLIPRKLAAPSVKGEKVIYVSHAWLAKLNSEATLHTDGGLIGATIWKREPVGVPCIRFVGIRPGEVILDREKLVAASEWCDERKNQTGNTNTWFENLCVALGLGGAQ